MGKLRHSVSLHVCLSTVQLLSHRLQDLTQAYLKPFRFRIDFIPYAIYSSFILLHHLLLCCRLFSCNTYSSSSQWIFAALSLPQAGNKNA